MSHTEQYEYRCYVAANCRPILSKTMFLDLCSMLNVDSHDVDSIKHSGLTNPQIAAIKSGDTMKLIKEGVLR